MPRRSTRYDDGSFDLPNRFADRDRRRNANAHEWVPPSMIQERAPSYTSGAPPPSYRGLSHSHRHRIVEPGTQPRTARERAPSRPPSYREHDDNRPSHGGRRSETYAQAEMYSQFDRMGLANRRAAIENHPYLSGMVREQAQHSEWHDYERARRELREEFPHENGGHTYRSSEDRTARADSAYRRWEDEVQLREREYRGHRAAQSEVGRRSMAADLARYRIR